MSLCRIVRPYSKLFRRDKSDLSLNEYRSKSLYKYFLPIQTRWRDNDMYGHVNNVVYYEWIDSIVNNYLIEKCSLNPLKSSRIGFVVSSYCSYYSPISYPNEILSALFVKRIGNSSVDYQVGIFENKSVDKASAVGGFTHVFVDRKTNRPEKFDESFRNELFQIFNRID